MATLVTDVVCGMNIDAETAAATSQFQGTTYYFCAEACKTEFDANPAKFAQGRAEHLEPPATMMASTPGAERSDAGAGARPAKRWWEFWKN
jgi:Cu+-exporting ATPase